MERALFLILSKFCVCFYNQIDEKHPYDNLLSLSDVNEVEIVSKSDDFIELHLINKMFDDKSIVKVVVVEQ